MAGFTETIREGVSIPGAPVYPISTNNATRTTGVVDMSKFNRVTFLGEIGAITALSSVRGYLQESDYANGASATNISGAIVTNIVNTANSAFTIEVNSTQLTKRYVVGVIEENATLAATIGMYPLATQPRYHPSNSNDVNTVLQRVVV